MANNVEQMEEKYLDKGGVLANVYIDLHAQTKAEVEELAVGLIAKMSKEPGIGYALGKVQEGVENEGVYSTSGEVKVLAESFPTLFSFCLKYAPIGVEIYKPSEIRLTANEVVKMLLTSVNVIQEYNRIIMEKVMEPQQFDAYSKLLERKREVGKRLLEKLSPGKGKEKQEGEGNEHS